MSRSERRHRTESFRCCAVDVASAGALCHELGNFDVVVTHDSEFRTVKRARPHFLTIDVEFSDVRGIVGAAAIKAS